MATQIQDDIWCIDSDASTHMSSRKDWFTNYSKSDKKEINCANDVKLASEGVGNIRVKLEDTGKNLSVDNMSYVSGLNTNLLNVSAMVKKNMLVLFSEEGCEILEEEQHKDSRGVYLKGEREKRNLHTRNK